MPREKGPDEIYCRSCGDPIKKKAEICPECGVPNKDKESSSRGSRGGANPPAKTTRQVSTNRWWFGVAAAGFGWILLFGLGAVNDTSGVITSLFTLVVWGLMPVSLYYDIAYVNTHSDWNPSTLLWVLGSLAFMLNIVIAIAYIANRTRYIDDMWDTDSYLEDDAEESRPKGESTSSEGAMKTEAASESE